MTVGQYRVHTGPFDCPCGPRFHGCDSGRVARRRMGEAVFASPCRTGGPMRVSLESV